MAFYGAGLVQIAIKEINSWEVEGDTEEFRAYLRVVELLEDLLENDGKLAA